MTSVVNFAMSEVGVALSELPPRSFLVHATNCLATWGAGIAAQLATIFPAACERYRDFCNEAKPDPSARWPPRSLVGKCLIIPPQESDVQAGAPRVYIVCLFTSYGYGRPSKSTGKPGLDTASKVLEQTTMALTDFRRQLEDKRIEGSSDEIVIYSPRFNSGAFKIPWDRTKSIIEDTFVDSGLRCRWDVMIPPA